jgi:hypothetical protein
MRKNAYEDNMSDVTAALRFYGEALRKDGVDVVNRAAGNAAYEAARNMPKASIAEINKYNPDRKRGKTEKTRLMFALEAKNGKKKGEGIGKAATRRFKKRKSSRMFFKAIWIKMAKDIRGGRAGKAPHPGGAAAKSKGKKAKETNPVAVLTTGKIEPSAANEMDPVFKTALRKVVLTDMLPYAQKKLSETNRKYSGR